MNLTCAVDTNSLYEDLLTEAHPVPDPSLFVRGFQDAKQKF